MDVLIVEGNQAVGDTLLCMLRAFSHDAFVARSLRAAIAARRAGHFDAYFIDMEFPDCGGVGVLGSLSAQDGEHPKPRSIGWTSLPEFWHQPPSARLFDVIVAKPASIETVLAALQARDCPECGNKLDLQHLSSSCCWTSRA